MDMRDTEVEPHFSQPLRPIILMLIVIGLVGAGGYFAYDRLISIYDSNPYLNSVIMGVFVIGVLSCFRQVMLLVRSVRWIKDFSHTGKVASGTKPPSLLVTLATLLRSRGARMQLSSTSSRSILDSIGQRIDEDREITSYLGNTLIFLGLLGTFYGLATTVPALVDTIKALNPVEGESGTQIFQRLQDGLQAQLGGMGTAFSSSLLGLAGSLVVGLLELFSTHGQNRFYRELEEWLSTITRVGYANADEGGIGEQAIMAQVIDNLAEQMEALQLMFTQTDISRTETDERLGDLASAMTRLAERMEDDNSSLALTRVADGQERLLERMGEAGEGMDAESRMRLRSIDVQMLRVLEEMSAGREETMAELRTDLSGLTRAIRQLRPGPRVGDPNDNLRG
ncbi:MAG: biopolymer transporter ExbB [Rhodobacteraceae bacterium]|nr:biopolymer transporter ExbB [Paracoccaceae bacterium]